MEKQKRWQFYLILLVVALTLYNILPTVFYYTKPLKSPIDAKRAKETALNIIARVDQLEEESRSWLTSFCKHLGIKPVSIHLKANDPQLFEVTFKNSRDSEVFKRFLPRAGALIPFVPAQLNLHPTTPSQDPQTVLVERNISVHLTPSDTEELFQFSFQRQDGGAITNLYRDIVYDRATHVALSFGGASQSALQLAAIVEGREDSQQEEKIVHLAKEIVEIEKTFGKSSPVTKRYFKSFTQIDYPDTQALIPKFLARLENLKARINSQKDSLLEEQKKLQEQELFLDSAQVELLNVLKNQSTSLDLAAAILKENLSEFTSDSHPLTQEQVYALLDKNEENLEESHFLQKIDMTGYHPLFQSLTIDWNNDTLDISFYEDVPEIRQQESTTEAAAFLKEKLNQLLINEIARVSQLADETISPTGEELSIKLNTLTNSQSFLAFNLGDLAKKQSEQILEALSTSWFPTHPDLSRESYPIRSFAAHQAASPAEQKLGLVVYAPAMSQKAPSKGFRTNSIYVIAKGLESIFQKHREIPDAEESRAFFENFQALHSLMQQNGFIGYPGSSYGIAPELAKDYIFELSDYYSNLLTATREDFIVKGSKRYAVLDFTDVEQRILTLNRIEDRIQEDLVKRKEEYQAAQVDLSPLNKYTVPPPTKNVYWENTKLSFRKYFRGDDRKILKWGLDLSGGKTVRIGLRDQNNRVVTNPDDLNQAVNELYKRVNSMGVAERTIRIEGSTIVLDFPGAQGLTASELIKASAMYFHVVNEKFSPSNPTLADAVNHFLQEVWNEAVVTNRKEAESINEIAWRHLGGDQLDNSFQPRSEYAKILYDSGLRFANPREKAKSSAFNDTLSSIAIFRGDDFSAWYGQTHPLVITFHNYALEGSSLENIQVGYDPSEGNILMFGVKRSYGHTHDKAYGSPREDFYTWTSQFSEDKIAGTPKEAYSQGRGWRMAVVLNDRVISAPTLRAALRDSATISGRFSQREINQLAADLKAGSLSFTPYILSEENVSPELGKEERSKGIIASTIALILVVVAMVGYYRFAGIVASCAVLLNLFIMWGVLQNLDAALTLPGIAGIVLTIGMAVDSNVLVFERIREEFQVSNRIASAIQAGYRKAFSAIIDSNLTTIMAAFILIQFDSGPIKGFALTLIIGIISSMFTALFMTRYFFAGWVQNPKNKALNMHQFLGKTQFNFLAQTKKAVVATLLVMVVGTYFLASQKNTIFGMDFTGGYALTVEVEEQPDIASYRLAARNALLDHGATTNDVEVRELSRPSQLRIQLGMSTEEKGHPFYQMPQRNTEGTFAYEYQKDPRIAWVVNSLDESGLKIPPAQLENLENNWTVMSGQFSDVMRNNAIMALSLALLGVLVYITFRFEFKYAVGAVAALAHDVLLTLGILALFHKMGFPIQIDLQVIGAIMTIIGYSLNDAIIVFDRIREDVKILRKLTFREMINHALNVTLNRTLMTSGTTLLVLLALVLLGGTSIFAFALVMTIGVIVGTLSSLFIAAPVMLYFHNREERAEEKSLKYEVRSVK